MTVVLEGDRPARLRGVMVDITERRRAEQERQARRWASESMDRVNRAIQGTHDLEQMMSDVLDAALSIFDCDRAWLVYPCDPEALSHGLKMQRTRPEFPGLYGVGVDVPVDAEMAGVLRTVRASNGPVQFGPGSHHPLPAKMAERLGVQSRIVMALYPKGDQPYMFGLSQCSHPRIWTPQEERVFQEIGRRLADALTSLSMFRSLRESEKRYRYIFESTGVSIWEEDFSRVKATIDELKARGVRDLREYCAAHPEFVEQAITMVKILDVNDASVKLFAAGSKDELLVSPHKVVVPETREAFVKVLIAIAEGRTSFEGETVLQSLKGDRLTGLLTVTFPRPPAPFDSVLVTVTDITERKRAEYLTGHVFETAPDAIYIVGRDYRYQRVNAVFERRWRMPAEQIVGMRMDDLAGTVPFEETYKPNLDRCFAGEEVSFVDWFPTPAGRQYLAATYSPLRPDSERVEAVLAITRDLTDHARASEALAAGAGGARARHPRCDPGRAGRVDRPRGQPAAGSHRGRRQRLPQLAGGGRSRPRQGPRRAGRRREGRSPSGGRDPADPPARDEERSAASTGGRQRRHPRRRCRWCAARCAATTCRSGWTWRRPYRPCSAIGSSCSRCSSTS